MLPYLTKTLSAKISSALILFFGLFSQASFASSHEHIQLQAQEYVNNNAMIDSNADTVIKASPIDNRIHIPRCDYPFEFSASSASLKQSNISVKVTCPSSDWYLFTTVQVQQTKPVVVTTDTLSPGTLLSEQNLYIADIPINRLRGTTFTNPDSLIGARLKRRVRPGQIISSSMLCFVCKGDKVTIMAKTTGLQLKVSGIAQQDGNLGDTIRVTNAQSRKTISATVSSTNQVDIHI
ncbi:flagellar basal body P-ring formation protein FlgA [Glaciecola sp. MH2013]|uniref:flagellar basal body P-ring formation chaperone FlgA n=1 Tax=Glaciecola sp. MH2013 TaxID=2785524 RepID=UPI00189D1596|nr:flagellar basal body P-ring formation chaperone FlgA [Glaciecola sp. MH2013]MBF7072322.1 flagellar basal body P-ring formation protein FlgA [Glaciecola sp. MH2013]